MSFFRSRTRTLGALLALVLLAAACADDPEIATVEGADEALTQDDVVDLLDDGVSTDGNAAQVGDESLTGAQVAVLSDMPGAGTIDKVQAAEVIGAWIVNELWYSAVAERGFGDVQPYLDQARDDLEEIALTNPNVPDLDTAFGAEVIRSTALAPIVADFMIDIEGVEIQWPVTLCSSHILLDTEEEAIAAIERLDAGEDFAALAMELSTGPSGPGGGDLGCVDPATFVPEFSEAATALGGPGLTGPVETQFGWHVIDVRSFGATPSDDPVDIQNAALNSPEFFAFQQTVIEREVTVDPRYGTWDTTTFSVIPAAG